NFVPVEEALGQVAIGPVGLRPRGALAQHPVKELLQHRLLGRRRRIIAPLQEREHLRENLLLVDGSWHSASVSAQVLRNQADSSPADPSAASARWASSLSGWSFAPSPAGFDS